MNERILVTGGAGFVGSNLAVMIKSDNPGAEVVALDNLSRAGVDISLPRLHDAGVAFVHGDVRNAEDLERVGAVDWLIECSAEPSVHAGYGGSPRYLINTNLVGAVNCLEHLRATGGSLIFLSSSRVYPIAPLRALPLEEGESRLVVPAGETGPGWSEKGISETFPLDGGRSMYGATKLAAELLIQEYGDMYGVPWIVNRCGVLTGPWQFGKVDQGVVALWVARHLFDGTLSYMGFGGKGLQVRDILHVADLYDLLRVQMASIGELGGNIWNVGGGPDVSISLVELTALCAEVTGVELDIGRDETTRDADIPYYVSDNTLVSAATGWRPSRDARAIVAEVTSWIGENREKLAAVFA